jgi:hypothetical protein
MPVLAADREWPLLSRRKNTIGKKFQVSVFRFQVSAINRCQGISLGAWGVEHRV